MLIHAGEIGSGPANLSWCRIPGMVAQDLLEIMVCPVCQKPPLRLAPDGKKLQCGICNRVYPVVDDIPIMLVEEAVPIPTKTDPH